MPWPSTSVRFLGAQWYEPCQDIPSKVKDKLSSLTPPTTKAQAQLLVISLGFGGNIFLIWMCYSRLFNEVTPKAASLGWNPEQEKAV